MESTTSQLVEASTFVHLETNPSAFAQATYALRWYVTGFLLVSGAITNLLSFVTMMQIRSGSTTAYLSALALSDIVCLVFFSARIWYFKPPFCPYIDCLMSSAATFSGLLILAMTCERLVVVLFPLKASLWLHRKRAWLLTGGLFIVSYGIFLPRLIYILPDSCSIRGHYRDTYFILVLVFYSCIPIALLISMNCIIILRLHLRSQILQDCITKHKDIQKVTWTVVAVSTSYTLLVLPSVSTLVMRRITRAPVFANPEADMLSYVGAFILAMVNHAINFWIYVLISKNFRKTMKNMMLQLFE